MWILMKMLEFYAMGFLQNELYDRAVDFFKEVYES